MPSDINRLIKKLEQLPEEIEKTGTESIKDGLKTVEGRAKRNLRTNDTNWNKDIKRSMGVVPYTSGSYTGFSLVTTANHAPYVEFGTGSYFGTSSYPLPSDIDHYDAPGYVSEELVENIEDWIKTKPVTPRYYSTISDLANAIAHTIAELGTQAQPFIRPAWYGYRDRLLKNVRNDIKRDVRRSF